jgi:hypothetical protein
MAAGPTVGELNSVPKGQVTDWPMPDVLKLKRNFNAAVSTNASLE